MAFFNNSRLKSIIVCFSGKRNFSFFIFITSVSSIFDLLILALISFYILEKLSFSTNASTLDLVPNSTQYYIDALSDYLLFLLVFRFLLIFIRILFERSLRVKYTEYIRKKIFIINSDKNVYPKITQTEVADFTSRISSWQLGANGLFNALTSIFSNITIFIIAPIWILKIADLKLVLILALIFTTAIAIVSILKKFSVKSFKKAVKSDVETADSLLYLYHDWRFLNSISGTSPITGKATFLISDFAKQMARSEVLIALIRPLLEITLILTVCVFFLLEIFGIGLKIEESLQIGLITLRLIPAVSGVLAGYTGVANNFVFFDHIFEFDNKQISENLDPDVETLSLDLFEIDQFMIDVQQPIKTKFVLDSTHSTARLLNITGSSGVGKSMLCDIFAGYVPWSGQIYFGGKKVEVRNQFTKMFDAAYLTQSTKLHSQSVFEYLGPEKNWKDLPVITKVAQIFPLVSSLGDNDIIGTDDRSLSGGQTQIIRLIKALTHLELANKPKKSILIDEGLSGIPFDLRTQLLDILMDHNYHVIHISHDVKDSASFSRKLNFEK